jgi:hypothetical protein
MSESSESHPWNILGSDGSMEIELELEYMSDGRTITESRVETDLLQELE